MGNLRKSFTDEEWNEIEEKLEYEKRLGKPDDLHIYLSLDDKNKEELIKLKEVLKPFYKEYQLSNINRWINYHNNKEKITKNDN